MPEQINLSDALALIESSKSDIKTSVENKGGTIGDDLTQYSNSISNIQFKYLYIENMNNIQTPYEDTEYRITRYNPSNYNYINIYSSSEVSASISSTQIKSDSSVPYDSNCISAEIVVGAEETSLVVSPHSLKRADVVLHDNIGNYDTCITFTPRFVVDNVNNILAIDNWSDGETSTQIEVDPEYGEASCSLTYGDTIILPLSITFNGSDMSQDAYTNSLINIDAYWFNMDAEGIDGPYDVTYDSSSHSVVLTPNENTDGTPVVLELYIMFTDDPEAQPVNFGSSSTNKLRMTF